MFANFSLRLFVVLFYCRLIEFTRHSHGSVNVRILLMNDMQLEQSVIETSSVVFQQIVCMTPVRRYSKCKVQRRPSTQFIHCLERQCIAYITNDR